MDPSRQHLNNLILGACHLCDRLQELARNGSRDPIALAPVREAVQMLSVTLDALSSAWADAVPPAIPSDPDGSDLEASWLLDGDFSGLVEDRGRR